MKILLISALALTVVACNGGGGTASSPVSDWSVDSDNSSVAFVTIKNGEVSESHHFNTVGGGVKADGAASITVDLASVATDNETRDGRLKEKLFEVATYPTATITAQLNPADFETLAVDERRSVPVALTVDLHGAKVTLDETPLFVTRVSADQVLVESTEPIQLKAADFNLLPGLATLQELAKLNSIQPVSPVAFSIMLTR